MKRIFLLISLFCISSFGQLVGYTYQMAVASMFLNEAKYFKEWIDYHLMIGVEHFWLYNDGSTDNWQEVLQPYIDKGIVEVYEKWNSHHSWVVRQVNAFGDSLSKAEGKTKWFAFIDLDEFIVPMQEATLTECLEKHFSNEVAVYVNWRNFGTNNVVLSEGQNILSHIITTSLKNHPRNSVGKSIVRPEYLDKRYIWSVHFCLLKEGMQYVNGDAERTITFSEGNLAQDGKHHAKYIRINHYAFRDETYFRKTRLPRDSDQPLLLQMNEDFSLFPDYRILEMIKQYHPLEYKERWIGPHDNKVKTPKFL